MVEIGMKRISVLTGITINNQIDGKQNLLVGKFSVSNFPVSTIF